MTGNKSLPCFEETFVIDYSEQHHSTSNDLLMISHKSLASSALLLLALATLPHCAKYQPSPLNAPYNRNTTNNVEAGARELTQGEFKQYFDSKLSQSSYAPVQLYINNNTDKPLLLDSSNINLSLLSTHDVAKKLHRNTAGRVCGWGIPGLFIWPILIPAVIDGMKSAEANKDIDFDITQRAFGANSIIEIPPHCTFNRLMVAHRDTLNSDLKVVLVSHDRQTTVDFTLPLNGSSLATAQSGFVK